MKNEDNEDETTEEIGREVEDDRKLKMKLYLIV